MITALMLFPVDDDRVAAAGACPIVVTALAAGLVWRRVRARQEVAH
jgi:hypothetical protein